MDFNEVADSALDINPESTVPMHNQYMLNAYLQNWGKDLTKFKDLMLKKDSRLEWRF